MLCLVCGNDMAFSFSKRFKGFGLENVDYWRCCHCGFTSSKTHAEMSDAAWQKLNQRYHATYQGTENCADDPRWIERINSQACVLADLSEIGILNHSKSKWLDFACGDGKLSKQLKNGFNIDLLKYDQYMQNGAGYLSSTEIDNSCFDFVITTSVFEHFTKREAYEFVNSLVGSDGVLGLHTVVCETIPVDPSWFYFLPVHTSFFTNKSMRILFQQWGYKASIYNVEARLWLWFKNEAESVKEKVEYANSRENMPKYIFATDFVDYWK